MVLYGVDGRPSCRDIYYGFRKPDTPPGERNQKDLQRNFAAVSYHLELLG